MRLLQAEQVHETLLRYLCMHYVGPTQDMYNLLCAAYDAKADSKDLAARVVTQMLFTGKIDHLEEAYEISKIFQKFFHLLFCSSTADKKSCQKKADTYVSSYYMPIVQRVFI